MAELFGKISQTLLAIVQGLNFNQLEWLIGHKAQLTKAIGDSVEALVGKIQYLPDDFVWWQGFYKFIRRKELKLIFHIFKYPKNPKAIGG